MMMMMMGNLFTRARKEGEGDAYHGATRPPRSSCDVFRPPGPKKDENMNPDLTIRFGPSNTENYYNNFRAGSFPR
jgi:hypothetical protein